jgi:hypothetical protein
MGKPDEDMSDQEIKGEKIMAKPITDMFPGLNLRKKHIKQHRITSKIS